MGLHIRPHTQIIPVLPTSNTIYCIYFYFYFGKKSIHRFETLIYILSCVMGKTQKKSHIDIDGQNTM